MVRVKRGSQPADYVEELANDAIASTASVWLVGTRPRWCTDFLRGTSAQQGDAVAFFNYFTDATCDWTAFRAALTVSSTKWIVNHWYHHVPSNRNTESYTAAANG
jgi:hypothetical protein